MTIIEEEIEASAGAGIAAPQGENRFALEKVVTIAAAHGAHDTYFSFIPPLLPLLIEKFALSKTEAGLLSVLVSWPAIFQPVIGYLADRANLRYLVILAPALSATMVSLVGLAPSYPIIVLLLLVSGVSTACFHAVAPAMVGRFSGKNIGRGMGFFMVGGELGFALGPLVVVAVVGAYSLRGVTWLMVFGWLVTVVLYFRLRDAPALAQTVQTGLPFRETLARMRPVMLPLVAMTLMMSLLSGFLSTFLPTFMTSEGVGLFLAGASFSVMELAATGGTLLSGLVSDRVGRRALIVVATLLTPVFALLFLWLGGWVRILLLLAIGFTAYSINPVAMAMVQSNFPSNRALANGIYLAISFVVRSLGVILIGALMDRYGMRPVFQASALVWFLALPFVFMLPER